MKLAMPLVLVRHSILLLVALAMLALALISLAGMSASVMVAEGVQGSASAINHAGSLRRLTYRVAGLVAADALSGPRRWCNKMSFTPAAPDFLTV